MCKRLGEHVLLEGLLGYCVYFMGVPSAALDTLLYTYPGSEILIF